MILAGGSGTRLWPMSRNDTPKQLLPIIGGRSLLELTFERLEGLVPPAQRWVCGAEAHRAAVLSALPRLSRGRYLGEPQGRDSLAAIAFCAAVIAREDPEAAMLVLTADHLIEPPDTFREVASRGFEAAESGSNVLVTFGVTPTYAATGYGYLRLGGPFLSSARIVEEFREKPDAATARQWVGEGAERYLWNSGMFAWKAETFLDCVRRYEPEMADGFRRVAEAWGSRRLSGVLGEVYPSLRKISVDFGVMEKASRDPKLKVAAVPLSLSWKDIGSWPAFAETCPSDEAGNALAAERRLLVDTHRTLVVSSDPSHLVAALGCEDLVIVHTPTATLVCRKDRAEDIKKLYALAGTTFGTEYT